MLSTDVQTPVICMDELETLCMHLFIYISFWKVQVLLHTLDLFSFCSKKKIDVFTRAEDFLYKIFRPWNTTAFLLNEH